MAAFIDLSSEVSPVVVWKQEKKWRTKVIKYGYVRKNTCHLVMRCAFLCNEPKSSTHNYSLLHWSTSFCIYQHRCHSSSFACLFHSKTGLREFSSVFCKKKPSIKTRIGSNVNHSHLLHCHPIRTDQRNWVQERITLLLYGIAGLFVCDHTAMAFKKQQLLILEKVIFYGAFSLPMFWKKLFEYSPSRHIFQT